MYTLIIQKCSGALVGISPSDLHEMYRAEWNRYVAIDESHPLLAFDEDGRPIPAATAYPDYDSRLTKTALNAMSEADICRLATARGYEGDWDTTRLKADTVAAFLAAQNK